MNTQRKRYSVNTLDSSALKDALIINDMDFTDAPAVNIHGVNISIGVALTDPEEIMRGRWYVVMLPRSVAQDTTVRNTWIQELDSFSNAINQLDGSTFVWGSGSFVCSDRTPFNTIFSPKTSRNAQQGSKLMVLIVADTITGLLDTWEAISSFSLFTSS